MTAGLKKCRGDPHNRHFLLNGKTPLLKTGRNMPCWPALWAISAVSVLNINTFIGLGSKTLDDMNTFSKMLLPTLDGGGHGKRCCNLGCCQIRGGTTLFSGCFDDGFQKTLSFRLYMAYTATSIAEAALGGDSLSGASNLLKWLTKTIMTLMMLLFVAYLSLTGVISGATDAVTARGA